jgi:Rad3-related DNA helicase
MFAVEFNINSFIRRTTVAFNTLRNRLSFGVDMQVTRFAEIVKLFTNLRQHQDNNIESFEVLTALAIELGQIKNEYYELIKELCKILPKNDSGVPIGDKFENDMIKYMGTLIEYVVNVSQLLEVYKEIGKDSIVVDFKSNDTKHHKPVEEYNNLTNFTMILQCTNESELIKKSVMRHTKYGLFMSATIGNIQDYATQTGIENYYPIEVPQIFDYSQSPIYNVLPMISMSYADKAKNMGTMIDRIIKVIDANPGERGLVHTGNYGITKELIERNHPRIMTYSNADEKEKMISLLKTRTDIVIAGSGLYEGIDLKDDLCRFMIWCKVPYISLADKLTKKKIEFYKNWYSWLTSSNILQGLGRGIRNERDYCRTYLLDSGFLSFFSRCAPPKYVRDRFRDMQSSTMEEVKIMTDEEFESLFLQ